METPSLSRFLSPHSPRPIDYPGLILFPFTRLWSDQLSRRPPLSSKPQPLFDNINRLNGSIALLDSYNAGVKGSDCRLYYALLSLDLLVMHMRAKTDAILFFVIVFRWAGDRGRVNRAGCQRSNLRGRSARRWHTSVNVHHISQTHFVN